jgi:hypothetical protein
VNAREERPDTLHAAVLNYLSGFVKPVVSSKIVIRMDLVHLSFGRASAQNTLIQIYVFYFASTFVGCHTCDGFSTHPQFQQLNN